jgi:hypothetical protein
MVATSLLFSLVFVQGIRAFGVRVTEREAEDFLHLWRYSSHLMGCEEALLPANEAEAELLGDIIDATQGDPDEDSKTLARALLESPRERFAGPVGELLAAFHVHLGYGFARFLLHRELPDRLGLPRTPLVLVVPACRLVLRATEPLRPRTPEGDAKAVARGRVYWDRVIELGLAGEPARFALPEALRGVVRGGHAAR